MAYDDLSDCIEPAILKAIFSSEFKLELGRIEREQLGSGVPGCVFLGANRSIAEVWRIRARDYPHFTFEDDQRLAAAGWCAEDRKWLSENCDENASVDHTSQAVAEYSEKLSLPQDNLTVMRIERIIYHAWAAACDEAARKLEAQPEGLGDLVKAALASEDPALMGGVETEARPVAAEPAALAVPSWIAPRSIEVKSEWDDPTASRSEEVEHRKLLCEAMEECIIAQSEAGEWGKNSIKQVRAAIRVFDHACGGDAFIEDINQGHVEAFYQLCEDLPTRWGKTKDELRGGIPASLHYAAALRAKGEGKRLGFSDDTLKKHVHWIKSVLNYADKEGSEDGHRPEHLLRLRPKRQS